MLSLMYIYVNQFYTPDSQNLCYNKFKKTKKLNKKTKHCVNSRTTSYSVVIWLSQNYLANWKQ